jgi:hypothetical protein
MKASPPTPVMFGSVTLRTAAMAIDASTALPPPFKTPTPTCEASGWLEATMPRLARTTDRPAGTPPNQSCAASAYAPAESSKNSRRLRGELMTASYTVS